MKRDVTQNRRAAVIGLALTLMPFMWGFSWMGFGDNLKHTGAVRVADYTSEGWQFERANGEMFVMSMDYRQRPTLRIGDEFSDVAYYEHAAEPKPEPSRQGGGNTPKQRSALTIGGAGVELSGVTIACNNMTSDAATTAR